MSWAQLFENIRGQLRIAFNSADDLLTLGVRGVLHQVGDLSWVQPLERPERHQQTGRGHVADERLDLVPVEQRWRLSRGAAQSTG